MNRQEASILRLKDRKKKKKKPKQKLDEIAMNGEERAEQMIRL